MLAKSVIRLFVISSKYNFDFFRQKYVLNLTGLTRPSQFDGYTNR